MLILILKYKIETSEWLYVGVVLQDITLRWPYQLTGHKTPIANCTGPCSDDQGSDIRVVALFFLLGLVGGVGWGGGGFALGRSVYC